MTVVASAIRSDVVTMSLTYALFLAAMAAAYGHRRRPHREGRTSRPSTGSPPSPARLLRYLVTTVVAGYVLFLAIDVLYYVGVGGQPLSFLRQAVTGGAWLAFGVALPAFFVLGWFEDRTRRGEHRSPR